MSDSRGNDSPLPGCTPGPTPGTAPDPIPETRKRARPLLLPLLVTVVIGCVVAFGVVPSVREYRGRKALTNCRANQKNIGTALEMYSSDNGGRFPSHLQQVLGAYLKVVPTCPSAGTDTYSRGFASASNPDAYTVVCHGQHHAPFKGAGYPQYTSTQGLISAGPEGESRTDGYSLPQASSGEGPQVPPTTSLDTARYGRIDDNSFHKVTLHPLSTFSSDVDTASYSIVRRFLEEGTLPPKDAVRIEELVNYFNYGYPGPWSGTPFAVHAEVAGCPWSHAHRLVRIGIQGRRIARESLPPCNLVFLVDVSGSMQEARKLPLVKTALRALVEQLRPQDHVAIVVYAGASGVVLPPTAGDRKQVILAAINRLEAGGSTNGADGIQLAYRTAKEHFDPQASNRVVLATDGDFNVGVTDEGSLIRLIEEKRRTGTYLTVLGFGADNLNDSTMQKLADRGNGNYAYIDTEAEARKVMVQQMGATLVTVANDLKIQVEFNPMQVSSYRLLGYEKRALRPEDFKDDRKDAGEVGAGHNVTALYEIVPAGQEPGDDVEPLRYQDGRRPSTNLAVARGELLHIRLRYKEPGQETSRLVAIPLLDHGTTFEKASPSFRFASAVTAFGMILRNSELRGNATLALVREVASGALGDDPGGYRHEFLHLVDLAATHSQELGKTGP